MAISDLTPVLQTLNPWQQVKGPLELLAWLVLHALILVIVTLLPLLRRIFGLCERLFLLTTNVWVVLVSLLLIVKTF